MWVLLNNITKGRGTLIPDQSLKIEYDKLDHIACVIVIGSSKLGIVKKLNIVAVPIYSLKEDKEIPALSPKQIILEFFFF